MRMSTLLNEVRNFELDEGFSPKEIKMAIGIASDPRYAKGNMTGAVNAIEKMKKGLSKHPQVAAVLKRQNENLDEAVSPAQQAAIAISKKERGEKPKKEGNAFGKELKAARDKGEKTFVVGGKTYNVEDYDIKEDGHTDAASAVRQCKTMIEDAMQISSKLQTMNPEESLPSWWTNKLAIASNNMNKLRDYFLVPTTEEVELDEKKDPNEKLQIPVPYGLTKDEKNKLKFSKFDVTQYSEPNSRGIQVPFYIGRRKNIQKMVLDVMSKARAKKVFFYGVGATLFEEVELDEKAGDLSDMKKLVGELQKASGMHLAQSKRVQAHVDMMKGSKDLEPIVGELEKASQAHDRQSKIIDKHISGMGEEAQLDELKMNDPKLIKIFDKIKPRDTIQLKVSSGLSKGKGLQPYTVKSKNTLRNGTEKITMSLQGNPTGVKRFLYKKDGKVTFAIGDMAASIDDIKEEMIEDIITEGNLNKKQMFDAVKKDVKSGLGKIAHRVVDTGSRFEVYVDSNDEKDAQRAMKDYILYAAGKLRVIPESAIIEQVSSIRMGYQTLTEKVDPADIDDTATDKDIENAGKNIIMQLRKSVSMRGNKDVEFADGKKKVDMRIAQKAIDMHMKMKPQDKLKFQNSIAKSYKDLLNTVKGK